MSSWKVDDEEVKVGRQWWRALKVALSKERLEVKERVMGKELRAEMEVEDHHSGKPTGSYPNIIYITISNILLHLRLGESGVACGHQGDGGQHRLQLP